MVQDCLAESGPGRQIVDFDFRLLGRLRGVSAADGFDYGRNRRVDILKGVAKWMALCVGIW
jgi:hypothetical protein